MFPARLAETSRAARFTEELAAVHGFADERRGRGAVAWGSEVLAVIGERGVQQGAQEVGGDPRGGALVQLGKGELRGSVDGHEKVELALLGPDLGDAMWKQPIG